MMLAHCGLQRHMPEEKVERRLAAIFAGDIAGYSRLMGADEEGTLHQLKSIRKELVDPKITEHRGRIVKTTGDGILVEFTSAVDAVRCAVEIQRGMTERNVDIPTERRIEFRIGINVGDIIIDGGDIYGDGVNVAARLENLAQPNGILVSRTVHDHVQDKLSFSFEDIGEQSVKNITRPVRAFRIGVGDEAGRPAPATPDAEAVWRRPAVAVLPFVNMSRDSDQDYFADGLTEDIITALSYWRMFPVIARNSTFIYKGRAVKVQQIATELGAKYVIEGSVRKSGDMVRVTVQLIDATTGHHVWAERYDRKIDDIFALQDEITQRIAATVAPELERAERQRSIAKQPNDLHAWDFFLRGMSQLYEFSKEGNQRARELFERTVAIDPTYSRGHTGIAYSHYRDVMFVFADNDAHSIAKCLESAQRAVALDETDAFAHFVCREDCIMPG
jgi:adenylate cyclase